MSVAKTSGTGAAPPPLDPLPIHQGGNLVVGIYPAHCACARCRPSALETVQQLMADWPLADGTIAPSSSEA